MSSLLDHLDNNYSDGDEDDHINRLFPKCKPRASSLQPFASNSTNESSLSSESRTSLSDCNLTNTNDTVNHKNINTVNNNLFCEGNRLSVAGNHPSESAVIRNGHVSQSDIDNNVSLRCLSNGPHKVSSSENSNKVVGRAVYPPSSSVSAAKSKGKSERSSRSRRNHHHHHHHQHHSGSSSNVEFVPKGPALHSSTSGHNPVNPSVVVNNKRNNSSSTSHGRIMECDTLDDHFDNGIGSGGSSGSNGSAFSQSSSLSSTGEKTNALSVSSSGLGSSGGNVGLRDSRIEIAGGREIFSQNRIKAGRRVRGSTSMDSMIVPQNMESSGPHHGLTPSSSQSQLQGKGRRKVTNNAPNPLISPSSPVNASSIWEPHLASSVSSKRNFPFSSSSSSSSRGGDRERERFYASSGSNPLNRNSGGSHGGNSYFRSSRTSQYYPHHHDYSLTNDTTKSPSMEGMLPQVHSSTTSAKSPSGLVMKETVFASEITSIEKPVEVGKEAAAAKQQQQPPFIYETPIDGGGEIVFDDIEDHWRDDGVKSGDKEATFVSMGSVDKSQLNFLETLMRDNEEQQQQQQHKPQQPTSQLHLQLQQKQQHSHHSSNTKGMSNVSITHGSSPSNPSGYDSDECASSSVLANNNLKTSPNNGNKRLIGSIPIAEYEGSPKRYGLRLPTQAKPNHLELVDPNSPTIAHLNVSTTLSPRLQSPSSSSFQAGARLPGFPLRIDTSSATGPLPNTCSSSVGIPGKALVNESSCESSHATGTGMGILMESNDHNSDLDGQLNSKLDGGAFTTTGNFSGVANIMTTSNPPVSPTCSVNSATLMMAGTVGSSMVTKTGTSTDIASDDSVASQQGSNLTTANSLDDAETEVSASHRLDVTDSHDDYLLYEFSETRKVLEEFFKPVTGLVGGGVGERLSNFDELDYTLKRQAGNSYVGQRLASESSNERNVEESPKKPPRRGVQLNISSGGGASPKLISFQEVSLPLSHNSHSQSSISPSSSMAAPTTAAMLLDSSRDVNDNDIDVETASTNTETDLGDTEVGLQVGHSRNFTLSPETTDCDSNELESEISLDFEASIHSSSRIGATMPVLEDGLSSGNVSDNEDHDEDEVVVDRKRNAIISRKINNNKNLSAAASGIPPQQVTSGGVSTEPNPTLLLMKKQISEIEKEIKLRSQRVVSHSESNGSSNVGPSSTNGPGPSPLRIPDSSNPGAVILPASSTSLDKQQIDMNSSEDNFPLKDIIRPESNIFDCNDPELEALDPMRPTPPPSPAPSSIPHHLQQPLHHLNSGQSSSQGGIALPGRMVNFTSRSPNEAINNMCSNPNSSSHIPTGSSSNNTHPDTSNGSGPTSSSSASATFMVTAGTSTALNSSLGLLHDSTNNMILSEDSASTGGADIQSIQDAVQLAKNLPSQRSTTFDASSTGPTSGTTNISMATACSSSSQQPPQHSSSSEERLVPLVRDTSPVWVPRHPASTSGNHHPHRSVNAGVRDPLLRKQRYEETPDDDADTDQETDRLLGQNRTEDDYGFYDEKEKDGVKKKRSKEDFMNNPSVLIEGVLFRARYLGSTQLVCEGQPTKATRMMQAEEAVSRIKAPEGETQPSTEVDLFISTEKIMVLNTDLKEIMMDHALRTISYIADIGDLVVLMARRRPVPTDTTDESKIPRPPKMICHVFESDEAQYIAQSIGQAFQVAYMEFLKANGIEDHSFVREMDYQEVLNSQEIFGDELQMFAKKELQKEVVVPKTKGEILGVVIVESGWGSMLPTVVIANLAPAGAAARCGQLNIGDQIIAINGVSLVGLPLSTCQNYIKNTKAQTVVKLTVVPCPPVVEVKIKRPDTKYQLGFSVQNGVICSLLRGGIAERGGVRVGHRIIEINNQSVVAVPHEKIVNLLATSVGEINMKTMPTSMFRLLTGQETPLYI